MGLHSHTVSLQENESGMSVTLQNLLERSEMVGHLPAIALIALTLWVISSALHVYKM